MNWNALGAKIGKAMAEALPASVADKIRASYAAKHGTCRRCDAPLAGHSPMQICQGCHADEVTARGFADGVEREA